MIKHIMEHFGLGILSGIVGVMLISFFIGLLQNGGMIRAMVEAFLTSISG